MLPMRLKILGDPRSLVILASSHSTIFCALRFLSSYPLSVLTVGELHRWIHYTVSSASNGLNWIHKGNKIAVVKSVKKREVTDDDPVKASVTGKWNIRKMLIKQRKGEKVEKKGDREDEAAGERERRAHQCLSVYPQIYGVNWDGQCDSNTKDSDSQVIKSWG